LSLEDWYLLPDRLIYERWAGVRESKNREINDRSYTSARIAHMVYSYMKQENSPDSGIEDYLPFAVAKKHSKDIKPRTARLFVKLRDAGQIPPNILAIIADVPGLYESICQVARE
jgi:hypothetical protein